MVGVEEPRKSGLPFIVLIEIERTKGVKGVMWRWQTRRRKGGCWQRLDCCRRVDGDVEMKKGKAKGWKENRPKVIVFTSRFITFSSLIFVLSSSPKVG
jgi:hypothetical protein